MKKLIVTFLVLTMTLTIFTACGGTGEETIEDTKENTEETEPVESEAEEEAEPVEEVAETVEVPEFVPADIAAVPLTPVDREEISFGVPEGWMVAPDDTSTFGFKIYKATQEEFAGGARTQFPNIWTSLQGASDEIDYSYNFDQKLDDGGIELEPLMINGVEWVGFAYDLEEPVYELYAFINGQQVKVNLNTPSVDSEVSINDPAVQAVMSSIVSKR